MTNDIRSCTSVSTSPAFSLFHVAQERLKRRTVRSLKRNILHFIMFFHISQHVGFDISTKRYLVQITHQNSHLIRMRSRAIILTRPYMWRRTTLGRRSLKKENSQAAIKSAESVMQANCKQHQDWRHSPICRETPAERSRKPINNKR